MKQKIKEQREFVRNAMFSRVIGFVYDASLFAENEADFIERCLKACREEFAKGYKTCHEAETLDYYGGKYGFSPETEVALMKILASEAVDTDYLNLTQYRELMGNFVDLYAKHREICEQAKPLYEELKRKGVLKTLPEYSDAERKVFVRKLYSNYTKYIRSWGIFFID